MNIHMHVYVYTCTRIPDTSVYICTCIHIFVCVYIYTYIYNVRTHNTHTHTPHPSSSSHDLVVFVRFYVFVYVCIYIDMYVCMYTYVHLSPSSPFPTYCVQIQFARAYSIRHPMRYVTRMIASFHALECTHLNTSMFMLCLWCANPYVVFVVCESLCRVCGV